MISTNDFKTGVTIELDGQAFQVVEFQHVKPGKGAAFVRAKVKNVETGQVIERTFRAGEKMPRAHIERKNMQYLYNSGDMYNFMDNDTYEQVDIPEEDIKNVLPFLKENETVQVISYKGKVIGAELPITVDLKIAETTPDVRGDTASGGGKPATLETGTVITVPFYVKEGDIVRVDTRSGDFMKRL